MTLLLTVLASCCAVRDLVVCGRAEPSAIASLAYLAVQDVEEQERALERRGIYLGMMLTTAGQVLSEGLCAAAPRGERGGSALRAGSCSGVPCGVPDRAWEGAALVGTPLSCCTRGPWPELAEAMS